jgi:hypothetical protein
MWRMTWRAISARPYLGGTVEHRLGVVEGQDVGGACVEQRGAELAGLGAHDQGLTLDHFSAQLERFEWYRGCA